MRIRKKFLQLTNYTYPNGTEGFLKFYLPDGYQTDKFGNFYFVVGESSTMFTCHLDTASYKQEKVRHIQNNTIIKTDGKTILGADDKAGMVVMLYMIEKKIPGLYYFFLGEEVGCIGSGKVADSWLDFDFSSRITKVVSFDRRGTTSIITHQWYGRCCSDEFANELANRLNSHGLNLSPDDTGVITDSAKFMNLVSECTNISVGYYNEHTTNESQDIEYLQKLCKSVCSIDWETLPTFRHPDDEDYFDDEDDDIDDFEVYEDDFSYRNYSYFKYGGSSKKMYISTSQINKEKKILFDWLVKNGWEDIKSIIWNGNSLNVETSNFDTTFIGNRFDLAELIPEISQVSTSSLKEKL